jgi:hypothetical protein
MLYFLLPRWPCTGIMTPEELNRTMEFIVASQAQINASQAQFQAQFNASQARINASLDRLAAAQEQDRHESKAAIARHEKMLKRLGDLEVQQADLLVHQSERMDRLDKVHADLTRQIVHLLNMILDRHLP